MPGESLEKGIQNIFVLGEDQGLILKASEKFVDGVSNHLPIDQCCLPVDFTIGKSAVSVDLLVNHKS